MCRGCLLRRGFPLSLETSPGFPLCQAWTTHFVTCCGDTGVVWRWRRQSQWILDRPGTGVCSPYRRPQYFSAISLHWHGSRGVSCTPVLWQRARNIDMTEQALFAKTNRQFPCTRERTIMIQLETLREEAVSFRLRELPGPKIKKKKEKRKVLAMKILGYRISNS